MNKLSSIDELIKRIETDVSDPKEEGCLPLLPTPAHGRRKKWGRIEKNIDKSFKILDDICHLG